MASTGEQVPTLRHWQNSLRDGVLHGDDRATRHITGDGVASTGQRLHVYTGAYSLRLLEILRDDFSALHMRLGEAHFERLARAYIAAHPSTRHSVRWFGAEFEAFLRQRRTRPAWISELAAFEWSVGEVLDAADVDSMSPPDLAAIAPDEWPELRLQTVPSIRLRKWNWNVAELMQAADQSESMALQPRRLDIPRWYLVWRHGQEARWRALEKPEAWALRALQRQEPLASASSQLQRAGVPTGQVPAQLVTCLQRWLGAGLIRARAHK